MRKHPTGSAVRANTQHLPLFQPGLPTREDVVFENDRSGIKVVDWSTVTNDPNNC
jgi:hypothetical protein